MGPFNGVVFAVVRRIVRQRDAHPMLVSEVHGSFDELSTSAAVFWPVVEIDYKCRGPILRLPLGPELLDAIPDIVARYFRHRKGDKQVTVLQRQYTERRERPFAAEVMIGCFDLDPALSSS